MSYANFDDNMADHPKIAALTDTAFRLHVAGILYSARHLTDGAIAAGEVPRLVRRFKRTALAELTCSGLWADAGHVYLIHDYLDWNDSREQVMRRREQAAERKRKQRGHE